MQLLYFHDLIIGHLLNLHLTFIVCQMRVKHNLEDLVADITENLRTIADTCLKYTDLGQAAIIDHRINRPLGDHVIYFNSVALLAAAVNTSDPLFNSHWVPRKIIVDHRVTELIVKAFTADFAEKHHIDGIAVRAIQQKTLSKLITLFIRH